MNLYRQLDNVFSAFPACQSCMGIVSLPGFFRSPVWAYQWAALGSAPQKFSGLPVKRWGRRGGTGNPFWVFPMPMKVWGTGTPQPPAANRPLAGAIHAGWHLFPLGGRAAIRCPLKTRMKFCIVIRLLMVRWRERSAIRLRVFSLKFRDGYGAAPLDITLGTSLVLYYKMNFI